MVYEKGWVPYYGNTMDAAYFVVSTNDVILNRSCRDMKVETFYVNILHKTGPLIVTFT